MNRWRGRQAARREQPLIAVLLTTRLVNTLLRLKHYLPLSGCPELSAKTKTKKGARNLFITYSQCVHVASPHIRSQPAYFCRQLLVCAAQRKKRKKNRKEKQPNSVLFSPIPPRVPNSYCNISVERLHTEVHSFTYTLLFLASLYFVRVCAPACVCVCAFTPVSPLRGLWFQRRPLYFLHRLATITKASTPLLRRLST